AADRDRDRAARRRDPHRGIAVVSGSWRARAVSVLGPDAVGVRRGVCAHRALAGHIPRRCHQPRGVRHQPVRRRAARYPRPAPAQLTASAGAMTITTSEHETDAPTPKDASNGASAPLLVVDGLQTYFYLRHGVLKAVDGVSFVLAPHETLAIVG